MVVTIILAICILILSILVKLDSIGEFLLTNIICDLLATVIVLFLSLILVAFSPTKETQYSFNINALEDNIVTSGEIHNSGFSTRGYFNGELSYFFSRTMSKGEIIGHIPANKTYIKYDNKQKPHIEVHQKEDNPSEILGKFFFTDELKTKKTDYYVIVVPEGTISNVGEYSIDME